MYLSPPSVRLSATAASSMNGVLFFSVTCRTEYATRLENGPISTDTPWSISRVASELPSSTFCCVSPGSRASFAPPSVFTPPAPLISSTASCSPLSESCASNASGPVTGRM